MIVYSYFNMVCSVWIKMSNYRRDVYGPSLHRRKYVKHERCGDAVLFRTFAAILEYLMVKSLN